MYGFLLTEVTDLTSVLYFSEKKLGQYLPQEEYFKLGLYLFDVGQNDLDGAFYSKSEGQVITSLPTILSEFVTGIKVSVNCTDFS